MANFFRQSLDGIKNMFRNIVNPDESDGSSSSESSQEVQICNSDCSVCASENRSLTVSKSSQQSNRNLNCSYMEPPSKRLKREQDSNGSDEIVIEHGRNRLKELEEEFNKIRNSGNNTLLFKENQNISGNSLNQASKRGNIHSNSLVSYNSTANGQMNFSQNKDPIYRPKRKYSEASWHSHQHEENKHLSENSQKQAASASVIVDPTTNLINQERMKDQMKQLMVNFNSKLLMDRSLKEIDKKIASREKFIRVAQIRKTEIIKKEKKEESESSKLHVALKSTAFSSNSLSLDQLQVSNMCTQRIYENLMEHYPSQFGQRKKYEQFPASSQNDYSQIIAKDPDNFTLQMTQCEINRNYLEEIESSILKNVHHDDQIVIRCDSANYQLTKGSLLRLRPSQWFNDEIINGYISLINQRESVTHHNNVFCFNTFFYTMLQNQLSSNSYEYSKLERVVKRKKVNLRDFKQILMPINIERYHWFLLCADLQRNTIFIADSMSAKEEDAKFYANNFKKFLQDYFNHNKQGKIKVEENLDLWDIKIVKTTPKQNNGYDCGLCLALNMEILSRIPKVEGLKYQVTKEFSDESRKRVAVELKFGKLLTDFNPQVQE